MPFPHLRRDQPRHTPGMIEGRLRSICEDMRILFTEPDQRISIAISVSGSCPDALADALLDAARVFVENALDHGMHGRAAGRIEVRVSTVHDQTALIVVDDGWGIHGAVHDGAGLSQVRKLAARHHGHVRLVHGIRTEAVVNLHHGRQG